MIATWAKTSDLIKHLRLVCDLLSPIIFPKISGEAWVYAATTSHETLSRRPEGGAVGSGYARLTRAT